MMNVAAAAAAGGEAARPSSASLLFLCYSYELLPCMMLMQYGPHLMETGSF